MTATRAGPISILSALLSSSKGTPVSAVLARPEDVRNTTKNGYWNQLGSRSDLMSTRPSYGLRGT